VVDSFTSTSKQLRFTRNGFFKRTTSRREAFSGGTGMTLALPSAPSQTSRRQVLVGTALVAAAAGMLIAGMLATFPFAALMAQWAVYAAKRRDGQHRSLALVILFGIGIAIVNAQVAVYAQMEVVVAEGAFGAMFYAITGTMLALIVSGMAFTAVAFFRSVGGRDDDLQVISANALYWYFLTAAFTAVWFFVYVQK
jgi:cytochrome c oxidase subunit 3